LKIEVKAGKSNKEIPRHKITRKKPSEHPSKR
jgi:hypothetical protein